MGDHEQAAMTIDQLLLQSQLADIILNAYMESSMTFAQLQLLVAGCGLKLSDLDTSTITINEEKEQITNISAPVPYTDWTNPNF